MRTSKRAPRTMGAAVALSLFFASVALAANDAFTKAIQDALASAEPTTTLLRGVAKMPDFSMSSTDVRASLVAAGATTDGPVGQVLADVTKIVKRGDSITIQRRKPKLTPIVIGGENKGAVKLDTTVTFQMKTDKGNFVLYNFKGVSVGTTPDKLYDLWNINWAPGKTDSTLTITAGWMFLSQTMSWQIPNAAVANAASDLTTKPSSTSGLLGKVGN